MNSQPAHPASTDRIIPDYGLCAYSHGNPRDITGIIIHCSATHSGWPLGDGTAQSASRIINRWHAQRGFARQSAAVSKFNSFQQSIGYHYVIDTDGRCDFGRSLAEVGAHTAGYNANSIGICVVGGVEAPGTVPGPQYTSAQWETLADLVKALRALYPHAQTTGHRDLSPDANGDGRITSRDWLKTCPGFSVAEWMARGFVPMPQQVIAPA